MPLAVRLVLPLAVFALVTGVALVLGAANVGIAATFGVVAFAVATVAVLLKASNLARRLAEQGEIRRTDQGLVAVTEGKP